MPREGAIIFADLIGKLSLISSASSMCCALLVTSAGVTAAMVWPASSISVAGDYYILDLSGNVVDTHIDPEELARKLGVLKEGEK